MADSEEFRVFCVDQVQRLSQFKQFEFMTEYAQRDYRKWLERKCGTRERVERVMDQAVELENMPTIAELNKIWAELYGAQYAEPEISDEERAARARYLSDWYAKEAAEAEARREAARKPRVTSSTVSGTRVTADDIQAVLEAQRRNQGVKA